MAMIRKSLPSLGARLNALIVSIATAAIESLHPS
jgi:hypothetical protein